MVISTFDPRSFARLAALLAILVIGVVQLDAEVAEAWVQRYANKLKNPHDRGVKVVTDARNDVVALGTTLTETTGRRVFLVKFSGKEGTLLWEQQHASPAERDDHSITLAVDAGGNVLVAGFASTATETEYYTAKYAADTGALVWEQKEGGFRKPTPSPPLLAVDGDGNVLMTTELFRTRKYAGADGRLLWEQRLDACTARAMAVDLRGDVVVAGAVTNGAQAVFYTAKFAGSNGVLVWQGHHSGGGTGFSSATGVAVDPEGNVLVTGGVSLPGRSSVACSTVKYAGTDGTKLWEQRRPSLDGSWQPFWTTEVSADRNGDILVTGRRGNQNESVKCRGVDGGLIWELSRDGHDMAALFDAAGDVVLAGLSLTKFGKADGARLWSVTGNPQPDTTIQFASAAIDAAGDVVVVWYPLTIRGDREDLHTAKYAAGDGRLVWGKTYDSSVAVGGLGTGVAIAVDSNGDLAVTGRSRSDSGFDVYTAKYARLDGRLLWERRMDGPTHSDDSGEAIAVDQNNNVVIAGVSAFGYYTAKYRGSDGTLLWERVEKGPATHSVSGQAVAVDAAGNVLVTAISEVGAQASYYTAKYAARDGKPLWERHFLDTPASHNSPSAIATDPQGNVVVTGIASRDFHTIAYGGTDGAVLWEQRYNGPANGAESDASSPRRLALGPQGMVAITGGSDSNPGPEDDPDITTILYRPLRPSASIDPASGSVRLEFSAVPGESYHLQRAASVDGPWIVIFEARGSDAGLLEFDDLQDRQGAAFYRVVQAR